MRGSFGDPQDMRGEYPVAEKQEATRGVPWQKYAAWKERKDTYGEYHVPEKREATFESKQKLGEVATLTKQLESKLSSKSGGQSVALGCTALLKAQHDGKMEWFESQEWYKKALKMCTSLSAQDDPTAVIPGKGQLGQAFGSIKRNTPMDLLKTSCKKLSEIPDEKPVRQQKWFPSAERMCSTVQSSTPEDLKALIHRQEGQAETASGQLLKQTCQDIGGSKFFTFTDDIPSQKWYHAIEAVCSKLGTRDVKPGKIEKRCKMFQKLQATGKASRFKNASWYKSLEKTCSWLAWKSVEKTRAWKSLEKQEESSTKDHRHRHAVDGASVIV